MSKDFLDTYNGKRGSIILKGSIIGVVVTFMFILLFSVLMLFFGIDRGYAVPFATVSVAAGAFFAALYSAKKVGHKGYLVGIITGLAAFIVVTLISLLVSGSSVTYNTLFHFIIIILSSVAGGILGINIGRNKKYI